MPASLITFAHSGVSFLMIAVNSAGVLPTGSRPRSSNFLRTSGIARALTVCPCNLSRTSFGVPVGASSPNHSTKVLPHQERRRVSADYQIVGEVRPSKPPDLRKPDHEEASQRLQSGQRKAAVVICAFSFSKRAPNAQTDLRVC